MSTSYQGHCAWCLDGNADRPVTGECPCVRRRGEPDCSLCRAAYLREQRHIAYKRIRNNLWHLSAMEALDMLYGPVELPAARYKFWSEHRASGKASPP